MRRQLTFLTFLAVLAAGTGSARADAPTSPPTPGPTATPVPPTYDRLLEADLLPSAHVTNRLRGTLEYKFFGSNFVELEYRRFVSGSSSTDQDVLINSSVYGRRHTYLATSTLIHSTNSGEPNVHSTFGFGIERLPDPSRVASLFFSYFYYPEVTGKIAVPAGVPDENARFKVENYAAGATISVPNTRLFLTAGIVGDHFLVKQNVASGATHSSAEIGIGAHL